MASAKLVLSLPFLHTIDADSSFLPIEEVPSSFFLSLSGRTRRRKRVGLRLLSLRLWFLLRIIWWHRVSLLA